MVGVYLYPLRQIAQPSRHFVQVDIYCVVMSQVGNLIRFAFTVTTVINVGYVSNYLNRLGQAV